MKRLLVLLFISFFSLHISQGQTECDEKLPASFSELNQFAPLIYNLSENCNYQPLHIEISNKGSFTIIGRFSGFRKGNEYNVNSIEFAFYDAAINPKTILVKNAWVDREKSESGLAVINVEVIDITNCNNDECLVLKTKKQNGNNDFVLNTQQLSFSKNDNLDFHITNLIETNDTSKDFFPRGRHCNGMVTF